MSTAENKFPMGGNTFLLSIF